MNLSRVLPTNWRDVFSPEDRRIGIGVDPATTTKKKSNPSSVAVIQQVGLSYFVRVLVRFKTSDDRVTTGVIKELLDLPHGLKVRKVCILANNERFYGGQLKRELAGKVPVEPLIESEGYVYLGEKMLVKNYLGNQLVNLIDDGYLPVPDETWVKGDLRQTFRNKGGFESDVDENGNHADAFCAIGAALHAVIGAGGPAQAGAVPVGNLSGPSGAAPWIKNPFYNLRSNPVTVHV